MGNCGGSDSDAKPPAVVVDAGEDGNVGHAAECKRDEPEPQPSQLQQPHQQQEEQAASPSSPQPNTSNASRDVVVARNRSSSRDVVPPIVPQPIVLAGNADGSTKPDVQEQASQPAAAVVAEAAKSEEQQQSVKPALVVVRAPSPAASAPAVAIAANNTGTNTSATRTASPLKDRSGNDINSNVVPPRSASGTSSGRNSPAMRLATGSPPPARAQRTGSISKRSSSANSRTTGSEVHLARRGSLIRIDDEEGPVDGGNEPLSSTDDEAVRAVSNRSNNITSVLPCGGAAAVIVHLPPKTSVDPSQQQPRLKPVIDEQLPAPPPQQQHQQEPCPTSLHSASVRSVSVRSARSVSPGASAHGTWPFSRSGDGAITTSSSLSHLKHSVGAPTTDSAGYVRPVLVGSAATSAASSTRANSQPRTNAAFGSRPASAGAVVASTSAVGASPSPRKSSVGLRGLSHASGSTSRSQQQQQQQLPSRASVNTTASGGTTSSSTAAPLFTKASAERLSRPKLHPSPAVLEKAARAASSSSTSGPGWKSRPVRHTAPPPPPEVYLKPVKDRSSAVYPPPFTVPFTVDLKEEKHRLYDVPNTLDPEDFLTPRQRAEQHKFVSKLKPPGTDSAPNSRAGSRAASTGRGGSRPVSRHGSTSRRPDLPLANSPSRQKKHHQISDAAAGDDDNGQRNGSVGSSVSRGSALRGERNNNDDNNNNNNKNRTCSSHGRRGSPSSLTIVAQRQQQQQLMRRVKTVAPHLLPLEQEKIAQRVAELIVKEEEEQRKQRQNSSSSSSIPVNKDSGHISRATSLAGGAPQPLSSSSSTAVTSDAEPPATATATATTAAMVNDNKKVLLEPSRIQALPEPELGLGRRLSPQRRSGGVLAPKPARLFREIDPSPPMLWLTSPGAGATAGAVQQQQHHQPEQQQRRSPQATRPIS